MTIGETLAGLSTIEVILFSIVVPIITIIGIYLLYNGVKAMWRPKDKTKPRQLYECTVCGIPFSTQRMLVDHMWDVHKVRIVSIDTNAKSYEVSYEEWEAVRIDEENKLAEYQTKQEQIDERVLGQITGDPENDPKEIINSNETLPPKEVYQTVSGIMEKPKVTTPSEELFNVQFKGDRILLDIAMTVPNTPEVIEAINKLNEAMGK